MLRWLFIFWYACGLLLMLTVGVPTAAARCIGPVSEPTNSAARRQSAANSRIVVGGAMCPFLALVSTIRSARGRSLRIPHNATLGIPCSRPKYRAMAPYRTVGHIFDVITNGFGAMPDYAEQIPVRDRWAIAAYVRALQLSGHATLEDVPAADRGRLDEARTTGAGTQAPETERR